MTINSKDKKQRAPRSIGREIFGTLLVLASAMTVTIAAISIFVSIRSEERRLDQNLQNIAEAVARSQAVADDAMITPYLDSLGSALSNIDVISVVGPDGVRRYHTAHSLIGTVYDGSVPDFSAGKLLVTSDVGPSGSQRRAYAAIYAANGSYSGFVLAVMLRQNINRIIITTAAVHIGAAALVIALALALSVQLSNRIKRRLHGYEPDVFSAMFSVRDNILESLEEGIAAFDKNGKAVYLNSAARHIIGDGEADFLPVSEVVSTSRRITGVTVKTSCGNEVMADILPVDGEKGTEGAVAILRDRTEFTKLMEDLSGVKYMVESMRANNHDFVNKLHVILGLVRMGETDRACEYIMGVTSIQQTVINNIVKNIEDPSVAALLIGKYARAAELNIRFSLAAGSHLSRSDIYLPSGELVTVIGNLTDNAMEAMNAAPDGTPRELTVGIFTQPHALLLNVDDTGGGIEPDKLDAIFGDGFSTKGEGRGKGLYIVKETVEKHGGSVTVESEPGVGTSFTVTVTDDGRVS